MGLKQWILSKFVTKYIKQIIQLAIAWVAGQNLSSVGINVDPVQASAAVWSLLETGRSVLKHKFGLNWL